MCRIIQKSPVRRISITTSELTGDLGNSSTPQQPEVQGSPKSQLILM
ncbi:hypothetical protein [Paenibacillus phytohabitans]